MRHGKKAIAPSRLSLLALGLLSAVVLNGSSARAEVQQGELLRLQKRAFRAAVARRLTHIGKATPVQRTRLMQRLVNEVATLPRAIFERKVGGESRMRAAGKTLRERYAHGGGSAIIPYVHDGFNVRWTSHRTGGPRDCAAKVEEFQEGIKIARAFEFCGKSEQTQQTGLQVPVGNTTVALNRNADGEWGVIFKYRYRQDDLRWERHTFSGAKWKRTVLGYEDGFIFDTPAGVEVLAEK